MARFLTRRAIAIALLSAAAPAPAHMAQRAEMLGRAELFAPGVASTDYSEIRLTLSPDGRTALWFSRDRPGGAGGYDIWMAQRARSGWGPARAVSFNSRGRDFDPAFSADGRFVFFCSDRPGGAGRDDIYRVPVLGEGFGKPVNLGSAVNSKADEFAPMLSADGRTLLFSSDRPGGAGGHDLFTARRVGRGFILPARLRGSVNTAAHEFDATFLRDGSTIVFARAMNFGRDRVLLYQASPEHESYGAGILLPDSLNQGSDAYGAMLDWSDPDRLTFSGQVKGASGLDLYRIRYRLVGGGQ